MNEEKQLGPVEPTQQEEAKKSPVEPQPYVCPYRAITIQFTADHYLTIERPQRIEYTAPQYVIKDEDGNVLVFPHTSYLYVFMTVKSGHTG